MPPFAGTPEEAEALVMLIEWEALGRPKDFPQTSDEAVLKQIQQFIDEAGDKPGYAMRKVGKR